MSTGRLRAEQGQTIEGGTRALIYLFQKSRYRDTFIVSSTFGEQLCDQINGVYDQGSKPQTPATTRPADIETTTGARKGQVVATTKTKGVVSVRCAPEPPLTPSDTDTSRVELK